jgi:chaperonin GroEL
MFTELRFADEARSDLRIGMDLLAEVVGTTLGPKGRNVALERNNARWMTPEVSHDGATVVKWVQLPDLCQNMGAQLLKTAALRTNEWAGDGTTTATVLGQAVVHEAMRNIAAGANPMLLKRGIEKATQVVLMAIREQAAEVKDQQEIRHVATISGHGSEIGDLVSDVMGKVGRDGTVTIQDGQRVGFEVEYLAGMRLERRGYLSRHFITNTVTREAVIEDAYILLTDTTIKTGGDLVPVLEKLAEAGKRNLVILADNFDDPALATLAANKVRGAFNCLALRAPGLGVRRIQMMEDLAAFTGGTLVSERAGRRLDRVSLQDFGRADRVVTDEDTTLIIGGHGSEEDVQSRIAELRREIEQTYVQYEAQYDREWLRQRIGWLTSSVAIIKVGAPTKTELEEQKRLLEDAVSATKAALEEGIVPGGGVALLNAISALDGLHSEVPDEQVGIDILRWALEEPLSRIAENAGLNGRVVIEEIRRRQADTGNRHLGFDALTEEYVDMMERGIIDPAKVARSSVENGVGVATMILSTEALVAEVREPPTVVAPEIRPGPGSPFHTPPRPRRQTTPRR